MRDRRLKREDRGAEGDPRARCGWRKVKPSVRSASAAGAGRAGLSKAKCPSWGLGGCRVPRTPRHAAWRPPESRGRGRLSCESLPGKLVGEEGASGFLGWIPSVGTGFCSICPLWSRDGDQGAPFSLGNEEAGNCRSVSLFRGNLCSPGVLPELLLLLGSLPRWGETGNSLRCPKRYGRCGGDGGEKLPEGPCPRHKRLGVRGGGTARSPDPIAALRQRQSEPASWALGTRRNRSGGAALDLGRALPAGEIRAPGHFGPLHARLTVAEQPSAPARQWAPCPRPHGPCCRIDLRPKSLYVRVTEALFAGGHRHWLIALSPCGTWLSLLKGIS